MTAPHTPGPWTAKKSWRQNEIVSASDATGCQPIAMLSVLIPEYGGKEASDANAHLIAAAPDLLFALRLVLPLAKGYAAEHPVGSNAAYIAKAEEILAKTEAPAS